MLTGNREYHNNKVEDIHAVFEVLQPHGRQPYHCFNSEDAGEHVVQVVESQLHFFRLVVVLDHHGQHVEQDN